MTDSGTLFTAKSTCWGLERPLPPAPHQATPPSPEVKPYVAHTPAGNMKSPSIPSRAAGFDRMGDQQISPGAVGSGIRRLWRNLPSDGFEAPRAIHGGFASRPRRGRHRRHAHQRLHRLDQTGNERPGIGSLVHECVHVVQQYGYGRQHNPHPAENPGYLSRVLPITTVFSNFEPQIKGAEIRRRAWKMQLRPQLSRHRQFPQLGDREIRPGSRPPTQRRPCARAITAPIYGPKGAGKTVEQLNAEWKDELKKKIEAQRRVGVDARLRQRHGGVVEHPLEIGAAGGDEVAGAPLKRDRRAG